MRTGTEPQRRKGRKKRGGGMIKREKGDTIRRTSLRSWGCWERALERSSTRWLLSLWCFSTLPFSLLFSPLFHLLHRLLCVNLSPLSPPSNFFYVPISSSDFHNIPSPPRGEGGRQGGRQASLLPRSSFYLRLLFNSNTPIRNRLECSSLSTTRSRL